MLALIYSDQRRALWVVALKFGLFFAGAVFNLKKLKICRIIKGG